MSKRVDFEQDEMMLMAIYAEKSREATIQTMQEAIEILRDDPDVITSEELIETIRTTIEKLQLIEDEYFYSLDLTAYLYEEDEANAY
ncbi:MAG: transposon-transfer assisting family protein [Eubacteriales bacterium]|nr:transposon-transfer assisting family protein [Eubacteriales bacterium]